MTARSSPPASAVTVVTGVAGDVSIRADGAPVAGPRRVRQWAAGREWALPPEVFWQVHPAAADTLANAVLELLDPRPGERALGPLRRSRPVRRRPGRPRGGRHSGRVLGPGGGGGSRTAARGEDRPRPSGGGAAAYRRPGRLGPAAAAGGAEDADGRYCRPGSTWWCWTRLGPAPGRRWCAASPRRRRGRWLTSRVTRPRSRGHAHLPGGGLVADGPARLRLLSDDAPRGAGGSAGARARAPAAGVAPAKAGRRSISVGTSTDRLTLGIHRSRCRAGDGPAPDRGDAGSMSAIEVEASTNVTADTVAVDDVSFDVERARSSASSAPTAPARPPRSSASPACATPDRGTDPRARPRPAPRPRRAAPAGRRPAPGEPAAGQAHGRGRRSTSTRRSTAARPTGAAAGRRSGSPTSATRRSASCPAARSSGCRSRSPWSATRSRDPRRADHRAGPAGPPGHLGADRADPRPRRDDRAGHPLHGGGRAALRPARAHRRRPGRRARHARGAGRAGRRRAADTLPPLPAAGRRAADRAAARSRSVTRSRPASGRRPAPATCSTRSPRAGPHRIVAHRPAGRAGQPGRRLRRPDWPPARALSPDHGAKECHHALTDLPD